MKIWLPINRPKRSEIEKIMRDVTAQTIREIRKVFRRVDSGKQT